MAVTARGPYVVTIRQAPSSDSKDGKGGVRGLNGRNFRCGGPHMARKCKEARLLIICYHCGKEDNIASRCDEGNGLGGAAVSETTPLVE